jgi:hypothetical protein
MFHLNIIAFSDNYVVFYVASLRNSTILCVSLYEVLCICITQGVPRGKVNILGGHSMGHSKEKSLYEHVSYSERFPIFGAQYFPSLPLYEQSQKPTDISHRFACFRHWSITMGGMNWNAFRIYLERMRKMTHHIQGDQCPVRDSNRSSSITVLGY